MKTQYQEHQMGAVMEYFVKGFKIENGELFNYEWFYDSAKGAVVFRLTIIDEKGGGENTRD